MWFPSPGTQRSKLFANILGKIWVNYSAENLFPSFKSPEKVLTIDLMPSFAYSIFTLQNCTGTNTAAVGGWNQMRPFLRRLKHNQLHSPYSKVVVNMIPHLNVYVHIGEETFTWVSEAFGKIQRKKKQVSSFLKYLSTVSAMMKMDSPDALFTMLLGMPQSQKEANCR